ncbi:MAG: hypothetical protein Q9188_005737 [Gyalolechia gomerana]
MSMIRRSMHGCGFVYFVFALLLSLCVQTDARLSRTPISFARNEDIGLVNDRSVSSGQTTKDVVPYQTTSLSRHLQYRPIDHLTATVYDWQPIQPNPTAVKAMCTLYNGVLASLSKLDENLFKDGTVLHFTYGSLEMSIAMSSRKGKREVGPFFSLGDTVSHVLKRLGNAALRGLIGFCKVVLTISRLVIIFTTLTDMLPGPEPGRRVALPNLIT